jgi:type II secretory pathway component GspD/PulD (secretin)
MTKRWILAAAFAAAALTGIDAQEIPAPVPKPAPAPPQARPQTGLKVQILLARYQGEKKISSLPYVLGVVSNGTKTSLRVGTQLPILATLGGAGNASASYTYRDLGTNIDCQAQDSSGGMYNLAITISDSSVQLESAEGSATKKATVSDVPAFRAFNATFSMLLRDGQTMQYASATDSVSGEVVKIDVSLNVLK